ncbi:hypothetical protein AK812_SmicGene1353 [Symbiodinium microadriaticum]|uniref:Uncharacterized protein n=1 Tax=Symbiodinium microadriaticum TaxID=2951 RepID=A0A1Q9F4B0_SYMMI|nr:hypothetical protein AK812_SmicGene1353 [Symbiodinium microadriaticum]
MVIGKVWVTDVQIQSRAVAEPACIEQRRATRVCLKDVAGRHKECRTRGEALDFYGDPKNQKDGLSSKQLKLIAGALDQSVVGWRKVLLNISAFRKFVDRALQLLGYDCPDAVQRWAKKVDDDLGEKSHQDRVTDLAPRQFRQFAAMEQTMASFNFFRNLQLTSSPARFQATRLSEMASRLLPIRGLATDAEPGDFSDVMKFCAGGSRSPTSGSRPRPNVASAVGEVPELDALKDVLQRFLAQEQAHLVRRVAELEEAMLEVLRGTVEPPVHVANQPLLPCGAAAQAAEAELSVSIPLERPVFLAPDAVRFEVGHISEGSGLKHHQHVTISPAHSVAMSQPTSPGSTRHGAPDV